METLRNIRDRTEKLNLGIGYDLSYTQKLQRSTGYEVRKPPRRQISRFLPSNFTSYNFVASDTLQRMSMKSNPIRPETIDLLSRITGQPLTQRDVSQTEVFLAATVSLLLGTIFVDGTVEEEEKQQFQATLNRLIPPGGSLRLLTQLMLRGIRQEKIYQKPKELQTLTASLSESERLLLVSFGYQMSAADGEMNPKERKYLEAVAKVLEISDPYLAVLESSFQQEDLTDRHALEKVRHLLDPAQFTSIDPVFIEAANHIQECLPKPMRSLPEASTSRSTIYTSLPQFQEQREKLSLACYRLFAILQKFKQQEILPDRFLETVDRTFKKLDSQVFRIAVIGEFSKGKSTLLNALLGEKIQPTRAIPCSGTISVLRYGKQKRVICHYKDGTIEEIPLSEYQAKASLSKEAAVSNRSDELLESQLQEIIFETPDLELCRNGVEIIDSPGLNEHPERSAITYKIIEGADAIVFLTSAQNAFTQTERNLVLDIKSQLSPDRAASNLFAIVNCMDLIDEEEDREDIKDVTENFLLGGNLISGRDRIYYLSAKEALKARLEERDNSELQDFQQFTQALESFLTRDRGFVFMQKITHEIKIFLNESLDKIYQKEAIIEGKVRFHEQRMECIEKIGEFSGRLVKIDDFANQLFDEIVDSYADFIDSWSQHLEVRLSIKSQTWHSEHSSWFNQEDLAKDYIRLFNQELLEDLEAWVKHKFIPQNLQPQIESLDRAIQQEIEEIKDTLELQYQYIFQNRKEVNWVFSSYWQSRINDDFGLLGGFGTIGLGLAILIPGIMFGPVLATVVGAIAGGGLTLGGLGSIFDINSKIKKKVISEGLQTFYESIDEVVEALNRSVNLEFDNYLEKFEEVVNNAMSLYENRLEQEEKVDRETPEQRQAEKAWIGEHRQQLEAVKQEIEAIVSVFS